MLYVPWTIWMVLSSPLFSAVVRAAWSSVALVTQKVAPREEVGMRNSDRREMQTMNPLRKCLFIFMATSAKGYFLVSLYFLNRSMIVSSKRGFARTKIIHSIQYIQSDSCRTTLSNSTLPLVPLMVNDLITVLDDWLVNVESHPPWRIKSLSVSIIRPSS